MSDEVAVMEPEVEPKTRKTPVPLTAEQKQAATLRRDATLLEKYGNTDKAKELYAQADAIAPVRATPNKRVDPLTVLSEEHQKILRTQYFETTKQGLARIAALVSHKKLAEIVASVGK